MAAQETLRLWTELQLAQPARCARQEKEIKQASPSVIHFKIVWLFCSLTLRIMEDKNKNFLLLEEKLSPISLFPLVFSFLCMFSHTVLYSSNPFSTLQSDQYFQNVNGIDVCAHAQQLQSCLTLCYPIDYNPTKLLCPWDSPGKTTGVGCHFLLQGIFLTQELNLRLLHCRWFLCCWATGEDQRVCCLPVGESNSGLLCHRQRYLPIC